MRLLNPAGQLVFSLHWLYYSFNEDQCGCWLAYFQCVTILIDGSVSAFQVNPGVYGDRSTRLFVYWTVSHCINYIDAKRWFNDA